MVAVIERDEDGEAASGDERVKISGLIPWQLDRDFRKLIPQHIERKKDPVSTAVAEAITLWVEEKQNVKKSKSKKKGTKANSH